MLRSCLFLLAAYAGLYVLYDRWLWHQLDSPERYIGAGVMSLLAGGSLGALYNGWTAYREWSLISAAQRGLPAADSRWTAFVGELHPVGEPVIAPFSGEACVLCEYEVTLPNTMPKSSDPQHSPGADFAGFLMNPCFILSPFSEARVLGFPNLVRVGWKNHQTPEDLARAREFLLAAEIEDLSGLRLLNVFSAIKSAWLDDDGLVRKNLRLTRTTPQQIYAASDAQKEEPQQDDPDDEFDDDDFADDEDTEGEETPEEFARSVDRYQAMDDQFVSTSTMLLKEKRVKVGEKVCAFGIYRAVRRGLVPGGLGADRFIKLVRGDVKTIEQEVRGSFFRYLIGGIIGLIVVHLGGWGVMLAATAQK